MKRHPALQALSHDHQSGLVQAHRLSRAPDGDAALRRRAVKGFASAWTGEILPHFADEERWLLPHMTGPDARRLRDDHAALRELADRALAERTSRDPAPDRLRALGERLAEHIRWEERDLFPRLERALSEPTLRAAGRGIGERRPGRGGEGDPAT